MKKIVTSLFAVLFFVGLAQAKQATTKYEKALLEAAKAGNASQVRGLLEAGTDPNVTDEHGNTPLIYGAKESAAIVDMLLYAGADVNAQNMDGCTALIYGFINIGPEANAIRQRILKANPDVNIICSNAPAKSEEPIYLNATALSYAIADNDMESVKLLLKHGADVNAMLWHLPLTTALLSKEPWTNKMVEVLLNAGANPWMYDDITDSSSCRFKDYAVAEADEKCALITKARATTKVQHKKDDKLYDVAKAGNLKQVKKLLAQGANPNYIQNSYNYANTPLTVTKNAEVAQALIDAGANVNARSNTFKQTPLFKVDSVEKAQVLIKAGADVNARDNMEATPLFYAKTVDIAKTLINAGANANAKDRFGHNALVQAKIDKNTEVATFLERYGLTTTNKDARTIEKVHLTQEELDAKHELWKAQQGKEENVGKTFLKGVAEAGAATLQYGIENNKF